jgi:DNA invertase Pin-like site-specific DNA recombinase
MLNNMKKASTPASSSDTAHKQAVIYARVSSKEQEKEGFSIPAQLKLLKEYAAANGLAVAQEYVDVETAKQTGRAAFGEMVAYLKSHPSVRVMLVEKTDRLYRNLKDWVTVDELDVEMHFPKEGVVLSRESRSSEKFMHGIKVLMAKNYIDNLSEEARKGMQEKAEQGIWPTVAPLGYRNVVGADGKKIIEPDPESAPIISRLFEWYATGQHSLKEAARMARDAGLVYRKSVAKVPVSTVHAILRNRLYTGCLEWNGKLYQGRHDPLVSVELWERVQGVLDGRFTKKHRRMTHVFAFSGLIACGKCGCSVGASSRSSATSIIIAPATPISVEASPQYAGANMCGRRRSRSILPNYWGDCASTTRCSVGSEKRFRAAMPTSIASMRKRSPGCRLNTSGLMSEYTPCMSISSTARSAGISTTTSLASGARSSGACGARSTVTSRPTSPTWTKACRFSNWPETRKGYSRSKNRAKNAACSISYFRTARGRMAQCGRLTANRLIF